MKIFTYSKSAMAVLLHNELHLQNDQESQYRHGTNVANDKGYICGFCSMTTNVADKIMLYSIIGYICSRLHMWPINLIIIGYICSHATNVANKCWNQ